MDSNGDVLSFKKDKHHFINNLKEVAIGIVIAAIAISCAENPDKASKYPLIIMLSLLMIVFLIVYIKQYKYPPYVSVSNSMLQEGRIVVAWEIVTLVEFSTSRIGAYIDIHSHGRIHTIWPKRYENAKMLRDIIEVICREQGIAYKVRDLGAYGIRNLNPTTSILRAILTCIGVPLVILTIIFLLGYIAG